MGCRRPYRAASAQVMAALAGIDIALWEIKGKAAGLPVYRLLGAESRPIFTYATGGYYRPDASDGDYGAELAKFIELGYRAVKLKTGAGTVAAEAARIGAVRKPGSWWWVRRGLPRLFFSSTAPLPASMR